MLRRTTGQGGRRQIVYRNLLLDLEGYTACAGGAKVELTRREFELLRVLLLVSVCALTYGFIAWVMPLTCTADRQQALSVRMEELARRLEESSLEDCGPLLAAFAAENDAQVSILDPAGNLVKGGGVEAPDQAGGWSGLPAGREDDVDIALSIAGDGDTSVTQAVGRGFTFPGMAGEYALLVVGSTRAVNQAVEALGRVWPWLAAAILVVSVLAALFYARFITRPIVDISAISQRLAGLDFSWHCREDRDDEIGALVRECVREYDELFEQKGQRVDLTLSARVWLGADPSLLKKAVRNLLSNAVLYSPEGAAVYIAVAQEEDTAALTIANEGAHLDPDAIPRLFEAFYRPDPSRNRQTGGSGLGLYLVKTIAERHGGDCTVRNTERGVEAKLTLPVSTENTHSP